MSATRAVLDAVTTALMPKLLEGPSWAVGPAKTVNSLWAAEVIDMFGRRGVLAIASESEYPDEPSEYCIVFLSRASGGALRTEARWSLDDLAVVSRGADEVQPAAAAVAGASTGSDGDGTADRRGSTTFRRQGTDSAASDARAGCELLLAFGSSHAEPWRCALPTPALRDEACWRLLAAGAVLCGGAAETNLQPNELRALATTATESYAGADGDGSGEGGAPCSGGGAGAAHTLVLRQPLGVTASRNSSKRGGGADRIRGSPDLFAAPSQPVTQFVDPLLRLIRTGGPAATEALAATASQLHVEPTTTGSSSSGWAEAEELERVLAEAVERCGFDGLTTSSGPESWRHDYRGSTAAASNDNEGSSSSTASSQNPISSSTSSSSSNSSKSSSAAVALDAALGFGMEEVERETVESLLAWELMQERAAAASKASHQNSLSGSRRKHPNRRGSMAITNFNDSGSKEDDSENQQGGAQPLLATLARLDRQLGVVESWLGSNGAYVDELRHDVLNIESLNALLETRSKNYQRTDACLGPLLDAVTLPDDALSLLAETRALLEQALPHQLPGVAHELAAAWTALGRAERAARDGGAPFDPSTVAAASASSNSGSGGSSSSGAVAVGAMSAGASADSAHPEGPSGGGDDEEEEKCATTAAPAAPTPTAAEVAAAARQHSAAATQFRTLTSLKEQATTLSRLRVTTTADAAISLDLLCAARVRDAASASAAAAAAAGASTNSSNGGGGGGGGGNDLRNVNDNGEGDDRLSTLEESSGRYSLSRARNDSDDSNSGTSTAASSPSKGLPLRTMSRTGFVSSAFMQRTTSKSSSSRSSGAVSRTVSRSIPSAFTSLHSSSSSTALVLPLISPPEAGLRLLECQSAVHQSLDVFDKLFEALYHLEPRHLATLAQSYATATADHLFYPHAKAFFRQCTLLLQRSSSSSTSNSSSKGPKVAVAALHALPKTATVAAVAAATAEGGTGTEPSDSPDSALRSPSSSTRSSDSFTENQPTSATLGDALTWALMQWMPAIRAEQRFLAVRFRLGRAADAKGVSADGMFPPGTLPPAAQEAADPPLDRETGRSAWGVEAAAALCGFNFNAQFAKWWQKVKQVCDAPELKESAELLVLLNAIHRATRALNGDDDDDDEDDGHEKNANTSSASSSSASASSASDLYNTAAALHAANAAAATLLENSTLHPNALSPRWLAARLHDLRSCVKARWSKFSDEQAVWTQANLTVSTDVRQCGVLPPFAKFAHLVVAVERATSPLAQQAKRATSARLQAQRDHQAQLAAKAAADAVAAAAQEKTFAALWKDGREEWEKHLGPDACFKLGLPPPSLTSPSAGTGEEGSATALAARGLPPGTASSAAEEKASKEDEDEQAAVLASSILGPRAACYTKIVASLFAGLERAANANDKYKDVCRLENYAFFADAVNAATNRSAREQQRKKRTLQDSSSSDKHGHGDDHDAGRSISRLELWHELDTAVADAREQYSINLARYLDNAFKYEFPELEAFFARIEALVSSRGVGDVPIHLPREQLLTLLTTHGTPKVLKDKLKVCSKRFAKHLDPALGLLPRVLAAWTEMLEARWSTYSARCEDCYNYALEPSTLDVVAFAREAAPSELS